MNSCLVDKPPDLFDNFSELVKDRVYFGGFPSRNVLEGLENTHFTHIVNLTLEGEMNPYRIEIPSFEFPIPDHSIPPDVLEYCEFISFLRRAFYQAGSKIYIHCRGGHGRSSMVCVSLWMMLNPHLEINDAITYVNSCHISRKVLRDKWRNRRVPFNHAQSTFLHKIHRTIFLNTADAHASMSFSPHYTWVLPKAEKAEKADTIETLFERLSSDQVPFEEISATIRDVLIHYYLTHRDVQCRLQLTFLRSFKFVGVSQELNDAVCTTLCHIRENLFLRCFKKE